MDERCRSRGVKLISVDYLAPESIYFGADNALAGEIAGTEAVEYIHQNWENKVDHLIVLGKYDYDPITKMRISSALEKLAQDIPTDKTTLHTIE